MRKILLASAAAIVFCGAANAEQFIGKIHKIEDGKITVTKFRKDGKGKKTVIKVGKKVSVNRLTINLAKRKVERKPLKDGLKNKTFKNIGNNGITAQFVTNKNNEVTNITLFPKGFKIRVSPKKKKEKKDG